MMEVSTEVWMVIGAVVVLVAIGVIRKVKATGGGGRSPKPPKDRL